jgi:hypothetical protein
VLPYPPGGNVPMNGKPRRSECPIPTARGASHRAPGILLIVYAMVGCHRRGSSRLVKSPRRAGGQLSPPLRAWLATGRTVRSGRATNRSPAVGLSSTG